MSEAWGEVHARNRAQYGQVAQAYATSGSHAGGADLEWFRARAAGVAPTRALDVACGGGFSTRALASAGHRVVASDLTSASLVAARGALSDVAQVTWTAAAAERLPVRSDSMGLVASRIAPHHFADPAAYVDEAARVLTPGGLFLLVDTTGPEDDALRVWLDDVERRRDPSHLRVRPPSWWRAVVTGARLRVDNVTTTRKRHELEPWLARAGCVGEAAAEVRRRFAAAPDAARRELSIEVDSGGTPVAYTDTKICLAASKPA